MKKIYIARHAKSSWNYGVEDFNRELKKRGRLNAPFMGEKLVSRGTKIEKIICSSAVRTKQTIELMADKIGFDLDFVEYSKDLYLASPKTIIQIIQSVPDSVNELMLVGHNPGVTQAVNFLASEHFENVPTSGVACIIFDFDSWKEVKNNGKLGFFIYPKLFKKTY